MRRESEMVPLQMFARLTCGRASACTNQGTDFVHIFSKSHSERKAGLKNPREPDVGQSLERAMREAGLKNPREPDVRRSLERAIEEVARMYGERQVQP